MQDFEETVAKSIIDLHLDSVQKSLDGLWLFVTIGVLFWLIGQFSVFGVLIVTGWCVKFGVWWYIQHKVKS